MKKPIVLAHRGFAGEYPENTALAFRQAVLLTAADGFESDVHFSKDGVPVIIHDETVDRTSNGRGAVREHTAEELRTLDFGAWKSPEFAGERICTLGELLDFCRETKMLLNLELKNDKVHYEGLEARVIAEVCARHMEETVFVSSFNHASMRYFKQLNGDIATGFLFEKPGLPEGADNLHPDYRLLTGDTLARYHAAGCGVYTWTVNDAEAARALLAQGVDGIITNVPDRIAGKRE